MWGLGDTDTTYSDGTRYYADDQGNWYFWNADGNLVDQGRFDVPKPKTDYTQYLLIGGGLLLLLIFAGGKR